MASTGAVDGTEARDPPTGPRGDGHRGRARGRGGRGRGRGGDGARGRGRGGRGGAQHNAQHPPAEPASEEAEPKSKSSSFKVKNHTQDENADGDVEVCFICANPITHYSVAPCTHITCHICALRLRALYKNKDCPHCRQPAPFVIFTDDGLKKFEDYTSADITSTDDNIGIKYASEDIVGDTVLLLRYNCPDDECDFAGLGWPDLHRHVRSVHHKKMCDLCTRHKNVFTHEHDMFTDKALTEHMRHGDDKPGAVDQTGFRGHPLCGFCGARYYDADKLYEHCRNKHERCFICDRNDARQPHYYRDYNELEEHFKRDHFLCMDRECLEKKFVVFGSEMDLKAHQLSEHGASMAKGRDARTVALSNFNLRERYEERRAGSSAREQRRRDPDPNAEALPVSSAQPLRRDELAFQRQMALLSGASQQAASTPSRPPPRGPAPQPQPPRLPPGQSIIDSIDRLSVTDVSSLTPEQRASLTRHGAVIERASNLLGNDATKMATFRSHISAYNKGPMTPEQLIDAFFALFSETSSTALGTLVREVADLFEDKKKGEALRKAWQNWRAINEDYPSLPGLGGMRGATTATSGWAAAAAGSPSSQASTAHAAAAQLGRSARVLKLKNSTRRTSVGGQNVMSIASPTTASSSNSSVPGSAAYTMAAAARQQQPQQSPPVLSPSSAAAFPALPGPPSRTQSSQPGTTTPHQPTWIGGTATRSSSSTAAPKRTSAPGIKPSEEAFPALPAAPKPQTTISGYGNGRFVRRDLGFGSAAMDTGFRWGGGAGAGGGGTGSQGGAGTGAGGGEQREEQSQQGGGGGKKKNKKQVLAHWG
ncbi:hypothetical protein VTK26DRAFT_3675 [Humicola hyalothermophila]